MKFLLKQLNPATHIMKKIWLSTAAVALASLLFIGILAQLFLSSYFLNTSLARAESSHTYTVNAFEDTVSHIIDRFVEVCGTLDFRDMLIQICSAEAANYAQINNSLQDTLHELVVSSPLIESAVITSKNGQIYRPSGQGLKSSTYSYTLNYSEEDICRITMLPRMESPIKNQKDVVPLAFPLSLEKRGNFVAVSDDISASDAILFLLLDAASLSNFLSAYSDDDTEGTLYLISGNGHLINPADLRAIQTESEPILHAQLTDAIAEGKSSGTIRCSDSYIIYGQISSRDLYLINVVPKQLLTKSIDIIERYLGYAAVISILLISLITLFTAAYITNPLRKLMSSVHSIESGTYQSCQVLPQTDEIGQLSVAIDSMYHTIQEQIEEIKNERQAKYNAEIRLFAEQINPHFLYNTLEYINMEVYNRHTDNAAFMIQSLGDFLRIGLNFGSDLISVSQELQHVQAYINIMNHRFDHSIVFTSEIEEELLDYRILKIILQPLVENSIRHGFLLEGSGSYISTPSITIRVKRADNNLLLSVIDNGVGIDVEKAEHIMHTGLDEQRHVGLNNVYQRLQVFYHNDTDITFHSIPYYKNTVQVRIPYEAGEKTDM